MNSSKQTKINQIIKALLLIWKFSKNNWIFEISHWINIEKEKKKFFKYHNPLLLQNFIKWEKAIIEITNNLYIEFRKIMNITITWFILFTSASELLLACGGDLCA